MAAKKKTVKKKAAAKKPVKKAAVKKTVKKTVKKAVKATAAAPKPLKAIKEPMTKTQLMMTIAERTDVSKKDVAAVFDCLADVVAAHIGKRGAGSFTMPGLMKVVTQRVPARKAKKNVPNPFRPGETMDVAARPAFTKVKVRPLKKLKDMVG